MALTADEKQKVAAQVAGRKCAHCGSTDMRIEDDGITSQTEWGVSGAYVACDDCGNLMHKEP